GRQTNVTHYIVNRQRYIFSNNQQNQYGRYSDPIPLLFFLQHQNTGSYRKSSVCRPAICGSNERSYHASSIRSEDRNRRNTRCYHSTVASQYVYESTPLVRGELQTYRSYR